MRFSSVLWGCLARWLVARPALVDWLIARARRNPYLELDGYMARWWLVQPARWLPFSICVHHILRADVDRNPHNHPWNFRTLVLRGMYTEALLMPDGGTRHQVVSKGQTYARKTGEYHRISSVAKGEVWTLFIMGRKRGSWGFMVDGVHVYWREYLGDWEGI